MLDKNKIYAAYSKPYRGRNQSPSSKFSRIKILYEDDISYYVASLKRKDGAGYPIHYSVKKHCFHLIEKGADRTPERCKTCPLYKAALKMNLKNKVGEEQNVLDKKILIRLLELVEDNRRTSASRTGLERRGENNSRMKHILCKELGIIEEKSEEIYWKYIERLGD